ncbi:MAG: cell division protein FtsQ/DivIB [Acidobacteriota bacterium]
MKEQVIATRGSRRAAAPSRGPVQRPARRDNSGARPARTFSLRALFAYVPSALRVILGILVVIALIVGYRVAASASLFQVRTIDVVGTSRTSAEEIEGLTRRAVTRTGVWRADLSALSLELGRLPGVRRAVVSRVLPDGLRVRIIERVPVAVVHLSAGHFVWVDDDGVALGEMKPADQMPAFFIRGWSEDGTDDARKENIERVQKYLEVVREWAAVGLSERVSEVNLIDVRDVRAQLAGNDSQIEVRLGGQEPGQRLKIALEALDVYKQTPRGSSITYVDIQSGRVVIGFSSGNKIATGAASAEAGSASSEASPTPAVQAKQTNSNSAKQSRSDSDSLNVNRPKADQHNAKREQKTANNSRMPLR